MEGTDNKADDTPNDLASPQGSAKRENLIKKKFFHFFLLLLYLSSFSLMLHCRSLLILSCFLTFSFLFSFFLKKDYIDVTEKKDGGVLKKVLKPGDGEQPPKTEQGSIEVSVHYTGWLLDGKMFDSSREKGELFTFKLGASEVIKGWDIGVASMRTGEKARFRIRQDYGYGESGSAPTIPGCLVVSYQKRRRVFIYYFF
jgi:hypothetical protein